MKKTFKTIVYGFMAMILFGSSAQAVLASATFNNHPSDFATIRVANQTLNPNSNTAWSTSVSANPGDTIAVIVYYHNNGTTPATSTRLRINNGQNIGAAFSHSISGSVGASNASSIPGSATVNLSSSQTLTYVPGSASWYANNQGSQAFPLLNGQNGSEIFTSSGLNIGTINPGWPSQGTFVFHYKVGSATQNQAPVVTTNSHSLNGNQATLNGYVNGQGQNPLTYFVYGTSLSLGSGSQTTSQDYQSSTATSFSETVNVNSNTTYYYKACATTNGGTVCGQTLSFFTGTVIQPDNDSIPNIITHDATNIDQDSAKLNGEVQDTGNSQVYSLRFYYGTNQNSLNSVVYATPSSTNSNGTDFSYQLNNLNDDTAYYFKACGTNSEGEDCGSIRSFRTDGEDNNDDNGYVEVTTLSAQSIEDDSATLRGDIIETSGEDVIRFFEYGEDEDGLDETTYVSGQTDNEGTFSRTIFGLEDNTTYYFRACIESQDSNAEDCGSIRSFRTDRRANNNDNNIDFGRLIANTTFATGVGSTTAVLNGVSINETNSSSQSYFQYGTSPSSLTATVGTRTVSSGQTLFNSQGISGLQANRTYYYRIVTGDVFGQVQSFTTTQNTTVVVTNTNTNTSNTTTTVTRTQDNGGAGMIYLALDITPDFENVYEGDTINFDVDYRNLYNGDLEDVVIHVRFPQEIEFRKATQGFYSDLDRTLTVDLGDLEDDEEGTILIQADVLGRLNNQDIAVTTAEGTYDHPVIENAQGSSLAHALNTILENRATLGAFALGAGIFPGVFGWLILILLVLLIVWISRKIYNDHNDRKNQKPTFQIN